MNTVTTPLSTVLQMRIRWPRRRDERRPAAPIVRRPRARVTPPTVLQRWLDLNA